MKKTIIFFLATVFSTVFFAISHEIKAVDSIEKTIEITQEDYETPAMLRIKMNDLISKGYTTIRVLSKTTPNEFYTQSDIQTRLHYLRIKGVTRISDQTDYRDSLTKCKTTSTSQSCTITEKKARGASVSSTFGATYKAISASVGFNVDTNYSLSISSTQKQPYIIMEKK